MITVLLKYIGFGFAVKAVEDQFLEEQTSTYNILAFSLGATAWLVFSYLVKRYAPVENKPQLSSTKILKQFLNHAAGLGVVSGIAQFAKRVDVASANSGLIISGMLQTLATSELDHAYAVIAVPHLPWEKLRFIILFGVDLLISFPAKTLVNGNALSKLEIASMVLGSVLGVGEAIYSYFNDEKLNLNSAINRRLFKLTAGAGTVFTLVDLIVDNHDRYTIADNSYIEFTNLLLAFVVWEFRRINKHRESLVSQQIILPNINVPLMQYLKNSNLQFYKPLINSDDRQVINEIKQESADLNSLSMV